MIQQTVAAPKPLRREELSAIAVAQGKKRDAGASSDRPEQRQDARSGMEQAGVEQSGVTAAGEVTVTVEERNLSVRHRSLRWTRQEK